MSPMIAAILGITEGITEFLPISSTGHLIIVQKFLGIASTDAVKSFDIAIQSGAILAAVVFYWNMIARNRKTWLPVIIAFVPTAIAGVLLHGIVKNHLLDNVTVVVFALLIGGILLILLERITETRTPLVRSIGDMSLRQALLIGCAQAVSIIPGVSRSAATILGGMMLRIDRKTIVDFSFLLAIPTMAGATGLDLVKSAGTFSSADIGTIVIGFVVSFLTALLAIKWLLSFIRTHTFVPFGIYRIAVGFVLWFFIL